MRAGTPDGVTSLAPLALRVFIYDWLLARGFPPTAAEIGTAFGVPVDTAKLALGDLKVGKTVLVHPMTGEIWMAGPFASAPTPYLVAGSKATWFANCAWDMLGVAVIANEPVRIETACTDCGEPMLLHADPRTGTGDDACVHFLVPARRWYDDIAFT